MAHRIDVRDVRIDRKLADRAPGYVLGAGLVYLVCLMWAAVGSWATGSDVFHATPAELVVGLTMALIGAVGVLSRW